MGGARGHLLVGVDQTPAVPSVDEVAQARSCAMPITGRPAQRASRAAMPNDSSLAGREVEVGPGEHPVISARSS